MPTALLEEATGLAHLNHALSSGLGLGGCETMGYEVALAEGSTTVEFLLPEKRRLSCAGQLVCLDPQASGFWLFAAEQQDRTHEACSDAVDSTAISVLSEESAQAEQSARDLSALIQQLMDTVPCPLFYKDNNGRYRGCNRAYAEFFGKTREEVLGKTADDLWPEGRTDLHSEADDALLQNPYEQTYDAEISHNDGSRRNVTLHKTLFFKADGRPGGMVGAIWDRSQHERTRESLGQALPENLAVIENISLGIAVAENRHIIFCNSKFAEMFGRSREELTGQPSWPFYENDEAGRKLAEDAYVTLAAGGSFAANIVLRREDATFTRLKLSAKLLEADKPQGKSVWLLEDVTEHMLIERSLRDALQKNHALLENALIGIMLIEDRRIVSCNRTCEQLFGFDAEELTGQSTRIMYASEGDYESIGAIAYSELGKHGVFCGEVRFRRRDGEILLCRFSARLIEPGDPAGLSVWLIDDITPRKEAERTLIEAKRQAEEATRTKSMFLANMSYEIRTPMNAVIGLSSLMLKMELPPKAWDYTNKIHAAGSALLETLDDILDFSKIEAGILELEHTDFHIDTVLDHVTTLLGGKAREKGLELLFDVPPSVPRELNGDPLRLGQILTNLVGNAIKFTTHGQIVVRLRELTFDTCGTVLRFEVQDTGMGMSAAQTSTLFQPFPHADSSTSHNFGGAGLGLSIYRRLVELMGGKIWVTSSPGVGSTFAFTARFNHGVVIEEPRHSIPVFLAGMHVLIAADNPAAQEVHAQSLAAFNFRIDFASSGTETFDAVLLHDATDPYRIVLMDLQVPDDGLDASRRIRACTTLRASPDIVMVTASGCINLRNEAEAAGVVMVTASGYINLRNEAEAAGVDVLLSKPVSQAALENALLSLLPLTEEVSSRQRETTVERNYDELRGRRVLLVEDNEVNQQIVATLLKSKGLLVDIANNGREALSLLVETGLAYEAVLMDLQMPEMDGYETTSRLRANSRFQSLPIIALTAHTMREERQRCLDAGMNDHVTKPLDPNALFDALLRWCGKQDAKDRIAQEAPTSVDYDSNIPAIPGLDMAHGLKRVAGDRQLYSKLFAQFLDAQTDAMPRIKKLLETGEIQSARDMLHTLAGAAGNLGAKEIWRLATELEHALSTGEQSENILRLNEALDQEFAYLAWGRSIVYDN